MGPAAMDLVPLRPLSSTTVAASDDEDNDSPGSDWKHWIGFDPAEHFGIPPVHYSEAAWCIMVNANANANERVVDSYIAIDREHVSMVCGGAASL